MNVTLNSLPAKTWYWLKMNTASADVDDGFQGCTPEAHWDASQVTWTPAAQWENPAAAHGFSPDLTALSACAGTDLVETAPDVNMARPIVLRYTYKENQKCASRLALHAAVGSTLSAVIVTSSPREGSSDQSLLQLQIDAEANAHVNLYVAQLTGQDSVCLHEISGVCAENASIHLVRLELGGKKAYSGSSINLNGAQSEFQADVAYHARAEQLLDMNYVVTHFGKRSSSLMEVCGTLEENARKIFRGTIDFRKGCPGSVGTENENVLLMGETMVNQTIPLILCTEEDVEGNHGASIGQLDEKVLFYLGSRGISAQEAQEMIARSRIEAVCSKIPDADVQNEIRRCEGQEASDASL